MHKPREMSFKRFAARLTEINNFLPVFPVSDLTKKMPTKELNYILLQAVPNGWARQFYFQGWDFEVNTYRGTCDIFEGVEISEQGYEGKSPSKKYQLRFQP